MSLVNCPCCHQPLPEHDRSFRLYAPLGIVLRGDKFAHLTQQQMAIVCTVFEKRPQPVTMECVINALYGHLPGGGPDDATNVIRSQVRHANERMEKLRISLAAKRQIGYQLIEQPLK